MDSLFKENELPKIQKMRKRRKSRGSKPVFKPYEQGQCTLLPPSLDELIPEKHIVRVLNRLIDRLDLTEVYSLYKGGGTSAYDPRMLLKVLLYGYINKIYTSRKIAKALREDINFMWLSGNQRPNFRTINNFRSGRLKKTIDKIFVSMLHYLKENNYIKLENYFVDGTKINANANKYTYVWKANSLRYKESVIKKINELLDEIDRLNKEENEEYGDRDLEELGEESQINSEELEEQIEKLNEIINELNPGKKKKKLESRINKIKKQLLPRLKKYEEQVEILENRRSYSKTDQDATFFRTKDGLLIPQYNVLIGTENQIILNYSIHRKASDVDQFINHIEKLKEINIEYPHRIIGDGGFGSLENYSYLDRINVEGYLKYNTFYRENRGIELETRKNFRFDKKEDAYICPENKKLKFSHTEIKETDNGFKHKVLIYKSQECEGCPNKCVKSGRQRTIQLNPEWEKYKKIARERLNTEFGIKLRKARSVDVETVFGDIKENQGFRRFNLRGKEKVNVEFGLIAMAHNIKKISMI